MSSMLQCSSRIQSDQAHIGHTHGVHRHGGASGSRHSPTSQRARWKQTPQVSCSHPANPHKEKLVDRVLSFRGWPNPQLATPKTFSEAGFYYLGSEDKVKCFNCAGGLGGWRPNEDPFYEHSKWFPECEFIQLCKGVEYVISVVKKHPGLDRPSIHNPIPLPLHSTRGKIAADEMPVETFDLPENRTLDERVEEAMKSEIVFNAMIMASDKDVIRGLVRRKLEREDTEYTSVMELIEDLQKEDEPQHFEETMDCQPSTSSYERPASSLTSSPASSAASSAASSFEPDIVADSFEGDISSIPAGELLMSPHLPVNIAPPSRTPSPLPSPVDCPRVGLEEEEEYIHEDDRCKVCLDLRSDCLFMPCNHLCCCTSCASALKSCPVCRTKLKSILKIYRR